MTDSATQTLDSPIREAASLQGELVEVGRLWLKIVLVNAVFGMLDVYNVAILGRTPPINLAGAALGGTCIMVVITIVAGASGAVEPLVAQAYGLGDSRRVRRALEVGIIAALLVAVVVAPVVVLATHLFERVGIDPLLATSTRRFLYASFPNMLLMGPFIVVMSFLQAIGKARRLLRVVIVANMIHLPLAVVLVHGDAILASLHAAPVGLSFGLLGTGLAQSCSTAALFIGGLTVAVTVIRENRPPADRLTPEDMALATSVSVGTVLKAMLPISIFGLVFIGSQAVSFAMAASLGAEALAGYEVANAIPQYAGVFAMALANCATIRVGWLLGARRKIALAVSGSVLFAFLIMLVVGAPGWSAPRIVLRLLAPSLGEDAVSTVRLGALWLLLNAVAQAAMGALRGASDMFAPMIIGIVIYWIVAVPLSYLLGLRLGYGISGIWWGSVISLVVTNVALAVRMRQVLRRPATLL